VRQPLGPEARAELQRMGTEPITRIVAPAGALGPVDPRLPAGERADAALAPFDVPHPGGRVRAVARDERLASRLTATGNAVLDAQATLADLAILACGSRTGAGHCNTAPDLARGVALVVPDTLNAVAAADLVLRGLSAPNDLLAMTDLDGLFDLPVPSVGRGELLARSYDPAEARPPLGREARRLTDTANRVQAYHSMLATGAPEPVGDPSTTTTAPSPAASDDPPSTEPAARLLRLLDVAGALNLPAGPTPYLDVVADEIDEVLTRVVSPAHEPITLTSADGDIQVRLENGLNHPVTVQVVLTSDRPVFEGDRTKTVLHRLPASSSSPLQVRVNAVSSGSFPIDVELRSPDEREIWPRTRIEVRSTVVSGLGLVLTIAAGLFLVVWWARHFRDARRARKLVGVDEVDTAVAMATGELPAIGDPDDGDRDLEPAERFNG
jgi:hypothetical protein